MCIYIYIFMGVGLNYCSPKWKLFTKGSVLESEPQSRHPYKSNSGQSLHVYIIYIYTYESVTERERERKKKEPVCNYACM